MKVGSRKTITIEMSIDEALTLERVLQQFKILVNAELKGKPDKYVSYASEMLTVLSKESVRKI